MTESSSAKALKCSSASSDFNPATSVSRSLFSHSRSASLFTRCFSKISLRILSASSSSCFMRFSWSVLNPEYPGYFFPPGMTRSRVASWALTKVCGVAGVAGDTVFEGGTLNVVVRLPGEEVVVVLKRCERG